MKPKLKKEFYDSELTHRGTIRKKIYTNNNGILGNEKKKVELKCLALKEFNQQKKPIVNIEKIPPYKRNRNYFFNTIEAELFDFLLDNARIF